MSVNIWALSEFTKEQASNLHRGTPFENRDNNQYNYSTKFLFANQSMRIHPRTSRKYH